MRGYGEHARPLLVKRAAKARALRYSAGNVRVDFVVKGLKSYACYINVKTLVK